MQTPTLDEIRAESDFLAAKVPPDNGGPNDDKLTARTAAAAALVASVTFRLIAPVTEPTVAGYVFEEVPSGLQPVARRAIAVMVERLIVQADPKLVEQQAAGKRLRSMSAGPYSEAYFAPGEFARRGQSGRPAMDQDDALDTLLWALATETGREYFIQFSTGVAAPAAIAVNPRWRAMGGWRGLRGGY